MAISIVEPKFDARRCGDRRPVFAVPENDRNSFLIFVNSFAFLYMAAIALGANQLVTRYLPE